MGEYNGTFSPDGRLFFYTLDVPGQNALTYVELTPDGWSSPRIAPFSGQYDDYDPLFTPDGTRLYFSSVRPTTPDGESGRTGIWYTTQTAAGWSAPIPVPLTGKGDYYSSVSAAGEIFFNVWDTGRMYQATPAAGGYQVEELGGALAHPAGQGDPFIAADGSYLIYRGYGKDSLGNGDLFISFRTPEGWTTRQNLGAPINSPGHEICPYVTSDGRFFIFSSNRLQQPYAAQPGSSLTTIRQKFNEPDNGNMNIYYQSADFIERLRASATNRDAALAD